MPLTETPFFRPCPKLLSHVFFISHLLQANGRVWDPDRRLYDYKTGEQCGKEESFMLIRHTVQDGVGAKA